METQELKEYFEKILAEKDKAINIALAAAKEAVNVAETNSEKWRNNANEWRGAMTDRERTFLSRAEFMEYKDSMEKILAHERESKASWITKFVGWVIAAAAIVVAYYNSKR